MAAEDDEDEQLNVAIRPDVAAAYKAALERADTRFAAIRRWLEVRSN